MHTNVVECIMLSNDSGTHNVHYVCMCDITLISGHQLSKFVFEFCANVGVMFERSLILFAYNGMGVRCSLLVFSYIGQTH